MTYKILYVYKTGTRFPQVFNMPFQHIRQERLHFWKNLQYIHAATAKQYFQIKEIDTRSDRTIPDVPMNEV